MPDGSSRQSAKNSEIHSHNFMKNSKVTITEEMVEAKRIKMKPNGHLAKIVQIQQIKGRDILSGKQTPASSRPGSQDKHLVVSSIVGGKSHKQAQFKNQRISASSVNLN